MSDRNTDEQFGFGPLPAVSLTNNEFVATSGSGSISGRAGRTIPTQYGLMQESHPHSTQPGDVGPTAIEFRVTRDGSPSRRLRLSGQRYTFGSGEGCSIRLSDPTLRPMHAVLIRDAQRILIRAYSVPIQVNGDRTNEATLYVGDLLQLGSYRLELLGTDSDGHSPYEDAGNWGGETPKLRFADAPTLTSSRTAASRLSRGAAQRSDSLAAEESVWREQLRREVEQWRMAKAECDRRESRCDDRESDMRERESELWSRAEHLRRGEAELKAQETAVFDIQKEFEAKKQSLAKLRAEDRARQQDFETREAEFRRLEQDYREQIERATLQLQRSQDQASVANQAVQRMRDQFAKLNGQLAELTTKQSELKQQDRTETEQVRLAKAELERARDEALAQREQAVSQRDDFAAQRDEVAAQLNEVSAQLDEVTARLDEVATQRDKATVQRDKITLQYENATVQRDDATTQRDHACAQRDEASAQHDEATTQRDEAIVRLNESISECEQAIRNRDESISQRDVAQRERDGAIDAKAKSDAQRIELSEELSRAAERLAEFEAELAESRRAAQDSERATDELQDQVRQLQESVASAKRETELLRSDYEEACQSITRLEGLLSDQTRHGDESKESWELEAEHLRRTFEGVSRDLAVALGELSELRDENTTFSTQLESMRVEKKKVETELQSRPSNEAWQELQNELELASESLQIIQRDYNATLTELEHLRGELHEERQNVADRERCDANIVNVSPTNSDETSSVATPANEAQWSDEEDAWPTYNAATAAPIAAAAHSASEQEANNQDEVSHREDTDAEDATSAEHSMVTDPIDDHESVDLGSVDRDEPSTEHAYFDELDTNEDTHEAANSHERDVDSSYWATPSDQPAVETESEIQETEAEANPWGGYPDDSDDQQGIDNDASQSDVEEPEYGSLANQLIADLDRQDSASPHDVTGEDEDNESFFEATAVSKNDPSAFDAPGRANWEATDEESPLPWRVEPESSDRDWEPTMIHGVESSSHQPIEEIDNDEETPDSTSPWSQSQYDEPSSFEDSFGKSSEYDEDNDDSDDRNDDLSGSHVWTSASDSVVMDSELVASDDDEQRGSGSQTVTGEATVVGEIQSSAAKEDIDDDSIEAYMNRLLQRVQGAPATEPSKTTAVGPVKTPTTVVKPIVPREPKPATDLPEIGTDEDGNTHMMPRSPASEKQQGNLSAMRQLANETARTAINRSVKIQTRDTQLKAFTKFGSAAGLIFCGLAVYLFTHFTGAVIIAGCMCVVAFVWVNEGIKLLGDARRRLDLASSDELAEEDSDQPNEDPSSVS